MSSALTKYRRFITFKPNEIEDRFFQWCFQPNQSIFVHDAVRLNKLPSKGYDLIADRYISSGSELVVIPSSHWKPFSAKNASQQLSEKYKPWFNQLVKFSQETLPNNPQSQQTLVESVSLGVHMMFESNNPESMYAQLLKHHSYPFNENVLPHPLLMPQKEYLDNLLLDVKLHRDIMIRRNLYDRICYQLFPNDANKSNAVSTNNPLHQEFKWAIGMVLSRGLSGGNIPFSLVPFLDFANHGDNSVLSKTNTTSSPSSPSGATNKPTPTTVNCRHTYDNKEDNYLLLADRDIQPGESLCISYGKGRDSYSFMTMYGFLGDYDNSNDRLQIKISDIFPSAIYTNHFSLPIQRQQFQQQLLQILQLLKIIETTNDKTLNSQLLQYYQLQMTSLGLAIHIPIHEIKAKQTQEASNHIEQALRPLLILIYSMKIMNSMINNELIDVKQNPNWLDITDKDWQLMEELLHKHYQKYITSDKLQAYSYPIKPTTSSQWTQQDYYDYQQHLLRMSDKLKRVETSMISEPPYAYWKISCARILSNELQGLFGLSEVLELAKQE